MEEIYELTVEVLGPEAGQCKEVRVLNRVLRWTDSGVEYEADPRHVEIIRKQLNIESCKTVATLGIKDEGHAKDVNISKDKLHFLKSISILARTSDIFQNQCQY